MDEFSKSVVVNWQNTIKEDENQKAQLTLAWAPASSTVDKHKVLTLNCARQIATEG